MKRDWYLGLLLVAVVACGSPAPKPTESAALPAPTGPAVGDGCVAALAHEIARDASGDVWVDRAYLRAMLRSTDDVTGATTSQIPNGDGGMKGLHVDQTEPGGLFDRLGFLPGDDIEALGGFPLVGLLEALKAYEVIKTAEKVTVQITRGGTRIEQVLHLCD